MSSFYKMDPSAWDFGTANLSLEEEAAYLRIVNAIHKHDHPVPDNDRVLAGMFRCSTRKARALVNALIGAGKVRIQDGHITNDRAISDVVRRGFVSNSRAESGAKGGRTRAENAAKPLENKEPPQAIASSRIEENRRDIPLPDGNGGDAPEIDDPKKVFWSNAKDYLIRNGVSEKSAGSFVGKCLREHGLDRSRGAFRAAQADRAAEPIPWITASLTKPEHQPAINDNVLRGLRERLGISDEDWSKTA